MRVSVIISNRNDVTMLAVTMRSAIEELSAVPGGGEVIICDNSDTEYLEAVNSVIPRRYYNKQVRLYYQNFPCLFTARETAAREASGEYIICVDSHMIFGHNSIINAVNFMNRNRKKPIGFGSIPVNWLCQHEAASRHDMKELYGTWGTLYHNERKITWKGMPWICRRDWFLNVLGAYGALSQNRMSWGGGDMYLGIKAWLLGFENWAIPSRPVIHIGPMPLAARKFHKYRLYKESGEQIPTIGFLVAFYALGVDDSYFDRPEINSFLTKRVGAEFKKHIPLARELSSIDRKWIESRSIITFDELEKTKPWAASIEYKPFFMQFKKRFNPAKSLRAEDWDLIQLLVRKYDIKTAIEFGSGMSTLLLDRLHIELISVETDFDYLQKVNDLCTGDVTFKHWHNIEDLELPDVDFVLVDGIDPRNHQIDLAMKHSSLILVHDGYSNPTSRFISEKLSDWHEIKVNSIRLKLFERKEK